jgi:hypothetical protein
MGWSDFIKQLLIGVCLMIISASAVAQLRMLPYGAEIWIGRYSPALAGAAMMLGVSYFSVQLETDDERRRQAQQERPAGALHQRRRA